MIQRDKTKFKQYILWMLREEMNSYQQYAIINDITFKELIRRSLEAYVKDKASNKK